MTQLLAQSAHWAVALVPVLVMLGLFVWVDAFKLMSLPEILVLLLLGGLSALAAWPVAGRFLDTLPIGFNSYSRYVAPWIEEAIKAAAMILLFRLNRIGYKLDAVISGFAIGAGFSVVENIIYLIRFPDYGAGTWLVRGLGTAVMHGTTLAFLAAIAHQLAERETRESAGEFDFRLWWFVPGYLVAVAVHTAFNQFPERPLVAMLGAIVVAPLAIMGIFRLGQSEAERWLVAEEAEHQAEVDALRSGRWPDIPTARRIAALAERLGPGATTRVRRYWELYAWLVAQGEKVMLEQEQGDVKFDAGEVRAALAELDGLKRALGRSSVTALNALLPFSRNDYWELAELKQRLGRS